MTKKQITKQTNIMEAMDINPNAIEVLSEAGLGCVGCALAHAETLEEGLLAHGFESKQIDEVIEKLNK